jgi:hypothetical protein
VSALPCDENTMGLHSQASKLPAWCRAAAAHINKAADGAAAAAAVLLATQALPIGVMLIQDGRVLRRWPGQANLGHM